jgi:transposase
MERFNMSGQHADFLIVEPEYEITLIEKYLCGEIPFKDLHASLGFSKSHLRRKIARYRELGSAGLTRKKRIGASNQIAAAFRVQIVNLVKEHYPDFGPTFAAEMLQEQHGISVKVPTLRRWMIDEGLWQTRFERQPKVYSPRARRECRGELIQVF